MKELRPYQLIAVEQCWTALKANDKPVLLVASVGAGKSLMLANILLTMQKAGKRALCLVNNAELVRNNCATLIEEGGSASIYCAALGEKNHSAPIVFGTPQSILNGINKNEEIAQITFNLIVVDEAHAINYLNHRSCFIRILRHFKSIYPDVRLLGATGTNFRYKGTTIVGEDCLFKSQVGNITTEQLIADKYLINPSFEIDEELVIDFSKVKLKSNGQFDQKQLEEVIDKSTRLTELICKQVVHIMESQQRFGCFLFATTKKHAYEILSHLPPDESAIILGETPQHERTGILQRSRIGQIRYLVNIAIISVGVDVPAYDTVAYLRPTESLVLLVQTMGRALRLSPKTNKKDCLILDFAGNIQRHSDWDNPMLLDAIKQTIDKDKPLVICCPACQTFNTEHTRRCVGSVNEDGNNKRCSYYFEFKECVNKTDGVNCGAQNDIASRICHKCGQELIDPNEKLSLELLKKNTFRADVLEAKYVISGTDSSFRINCMYSCRDNRGEIGIINESYSPVSDKAARVFYGQFIRKHCENSHQWYPHINNRVKMQEMLHRAMTPIHLELIKEHDVIKIKKKIFV